MEWTDTEKTELYTKVQKMAATDEAFRNEMLTDPTAAMEKIAGKKLPENAKIKVIEQDPEYISTFVLPKFIGDELEDEDLDNVAGGGFASIAVLVTIGVF